MVGFFKRDYGIYFLWFILESTMNRISMWIQKLTFCHIILAWEQMFFFWLFDESLCLNICTTYVTIECRKFSRLCKHNQKIQKQSKFHCYKLLHRIKLFPEKMVKSVSLRCEGKTLILDENTAYFNLITKQESYILLLKMVNNIKERS